MKFLVALSIFFSAINCGENPEAEVAAPVAATPEVEAVEEEQTGILVGEIEEKDLRQEPFTSWFAPGYESYTPSAEALETIEENIDDYQIKVFMGTWCGDSKREVPKFFKLLDKVGYDKSKLVVYAVTYNKTLPSGLAKEYDINYVPTIIFLKDGKEVDRFVEYAQESLEADIAKIVSGQEYKDPYQ